MTKEKFDGKLVIITAPSGAGKTTIVKHLKQKFPKLEFSVSATTRMRRINEVHGHDYYFLSVDEFKSLIRQEEFLEWQEVYSDQFYGTLKSEVNRIWGLKKHILFDIDVKGAMNLQRKFREKSLSIFIKPPSLDILMDRLTKRGSESPSQLKKRIIKLKEELSYESAFDESVINNELEEALDRATNLVGAFLEV